MSAARSSAAILQRHSNRNLIYSQSFRWNSGLAADILYTQIHSGQPPPAHGVVVPLDGHGWLGEWTAIAFGRSVWTAEWIRRDDAHAHKKPSTNRL